MNATDHVLKVIDDGVATLTINRPEARNALSPAMLQEIAAFLSAVELDATVRCVVIKGAGENFMAGGDVGSFEPTLALSPEERSATYEQRLMTAASMYLRLERLRKPVVVVARGAIAGAGISIALAADLTIVSDTAYFFFAHGHLGLSLDGALSYYLPRAVGPRKARELALLNARVGAAEALQIGLVSRVVADADLDDEAEKYIRQLKSGATVAMGQTKALIEQSLRNPLALQFQRESEACAICVASDDFPEGVSAFLQKRKPRFTGR